MPADILTTLQGVLAEAEREVMESEMTVAESRDDESLCLAMKRPIRREKSLAALCRSLMAAVEGLNSITGHPENDDARVAYALDNVAAHLAPIAGGKEGANG